MMLAYYNIKKAFLLILILSCSNILSLEPSFLPENKDEDIKNLELYLSGPLFSGVGLVTAARNNNIKLLNLLIKHGVDVNLKNDRGDTALTIAALHGNIEIIELLINNKANLNLPDDDNATALMHAINSKSENKIEIVKLLIIRGADINKQDNNGATALLYAAYNHYATIIQLLIINGANTYTSNKQGKTFFDCIKEKDYENEIMTLIMKVKQKTTKRLLQHIPIKPLCDIVMEYMD